MVLRLPQRVKLAGIGFPVFAVKGLDLTIIRLNTEGSQLSRQPFSARMFLLSPLTFLLGPLTFLLSPLTFLLSPQAFLLGPLTFLLSPQAFLLNPQAFLFSIG